MKVASDTSVSALQAGLVGFIRAFGLQRPYTTACGMPVTTSEAHALMELAGHDGIRQSDLALRLGLEKSSVSRLIRQLEARSWVHRVPDPRDGRAVKLGLTSSGVRAAERLAGATARKFQRLLDEIPHDEREGVLRALSALTRAARSASE